MNQIQIFTSILILQPLLLQKVEAETDILGKKKIECTWRGWSQQLQKKNCCLHTYWF